MPEKGWWPTNTSGLGDQAVSWDPQMNAPFLGGGSFLPMIRVLVGAPPNINGVRSEGSTSLFSIESISPNPLVAASTVSEIVFSLDEAGITSLDVFDIEGRKVKTLLNDDLGVGLHTIHWDGSDANGKFVSSGLYLCHLLQNGRSASMQLIVIR
jgi:hypothetical protein